MIKTDVVIVGAGPVGLFTIFQCGMMKLKCHVVDTLDEVGGQCAALYPEKPIYDIPGFPSINGGDLIENLKELINISTPLLRSSELHGSGTKADLLASLCKEVGATSYVSPPGSKEYLDISDTFKSIGLPINYFEFKHPEYLQIYGDFLPYMSVIDMLFNCGEQSSLLIQSASKILK